MEEEKDIIDLNKKDEKVEEWIREKEMMVKDGEKGREYEK